MKYIILLLLFGFAIQASAQDITRKDKIRLRNLGVDTEQIDFKDLDIQHDLNTALKFDRQYRTNTLLRNSSFIIGGSLLVGGVALLASTDDDPFDTPVELVLGSYMLYGGISFTRAGGGLWYRGRELRRDRDTKLAMFIE